MHTFTAAHLGLCYSGSTAPPLHHRSMAPQVSGLDPLWALLPNPKSELRRTIDDGGQGHRLHHQKWSAFDQKGPERQRRGEQQ